uniref:Ketoreductase CTB6 ) n=1 Tax=Ganoderma boninense TaxID=34458 RepID=A0A5K1JWY3_9APHY|nr:Ketoreductase CTB6 (EC (Cercosporin toxin biosynthesis cluster protein 6) [Ganoderma boninense]
MALVVLPNISVLISIWMETLFYGMYVVLFFSSFFVLSRTRNVIVQSWVIRLATVLMFCIATTHMAVNVRRLVEGFILPATKADTLAYLYDIHQPLNIVKQYLWVFNNVLADGIIVWRLYTLWNIHVCILPILLLLCTTAFGLATATSLLPQIGAGNSIFVSHFQRFATTQYAISLTNNVLVTSLISGRIWYVTREVRTSGYATGSDYRRAILVVIESGALYALTQVIQLAWYVAKFPGLYFVADSFVQIMAIVPTSVVLLVALGRTLVEESQAAASGVLSEMKFTSGATKSSRTLGSMKEGYALDRVMTEPKFKPGEMPAHSQVLLPPGPAEELA